MLPIRKPLTPNVSKNPMKVASKGAGELEPVLVLYGAPKTGKTTLTYAIPNAVHIMTEKGTRNEHVPVRDWDALCAAVEQVPVSVPLVIDTIDGCWELCREFVSKALRVSVPEDAGYGQGTARVKSLWSQFVRSTINHPLTVFVGHELAKTKNVAGLEIEKFSHQMPQSGRYYLEALADATICLRRDGAKRKLIIKDGMDETVGCRYPDWFSGLAAVDLTDNPEKACQIFSGLLRTLT